MPYHSLSAGSLHLLRPRMLAPLVLAVLLLLLEALPACASIPNRVYRVEIRPRQDFTRISVKLANPPHYALAPLPGNRLRLTLSDTGGPLFRKYRRYSDPNIGGLTFRRRGEDLLITFPMGVGRGWRDIHVDGVSAVTIDVGRRFVPAAPRPATSGREKIWNGSEKLVRDFDPPLKPEIPFLPTDRLILRNILNEADVQTFMEAEGALYKGRLSEAEEVFTPFAARQAPIRSLALYRLGETCYKLQKYPQALAAFREAEKLWPAFLNYNPGVTFYYGDSIARGGDLAAARSLLSGLIARLADKKFAPVLLVRLADILARQGHEQEALAIYRTVADGFSDNKAHQMALLRLLDREFFKVDDLSFRQLGEKYQEISRQSRDIDLREEASFKYVLMESLHGEAAQALHQVVLFQKLFPRGIYATICRTIREVLVAQVYRQAWGTENAGRKSDHAGLIRFVEEHHDYLTGCLEQADFLPGVIQAYETGGRPIELIKLFSSLIDRQWAAAGAALMYEAIADNAELLGDTVLAEKTLKTFLRKFPGHARARIMTERLGGLYYNQGKYQEARDTLLWLLNKGERAGSAESYYYLGRALWMQKQPSQAARAIDLFIAAAAGQEERGARLLPDAYYVAVSARESSGDRKGALRLLETGLKLPSNERSDQLLYKAGQLNLEEGRQQQARGYFERVVKGGKDPEWQQLARQALQSLEIKGGGAAVP